MTLGYSQNFPDGTPTHFKEKVLASQGLVLQKELIPEMSAEDKLALYNESGVMLMTSDPNQIVQTIGVPAFRPKLTSIRIDKHERWRPGMDIHHVYGNRTKHRNCFLVNKCVSVQRISIFDSNVVDEEAEKVDRTQSQKVIMVDGRVLPWEKCLELAINDGFNNIAQFFTWFNKDFSGRIIIWDKKLRY